MTELEIVPFVVRDTARLFYDKYAYKAKLPNMVGHYYCAEHWDGEESLTLYTNRIAARSAVYEAHLGLLIEGFAPFFDERCNHDVCYVTANPVMINFFFQREEDFSAFIDQYTDLICEVTRPTAQFNAEALDTRYDIVRQFRATPYFGNYAFKVVFDREADGEQIDSWVEHFFAGDATRHRYDAKNKQRTLYLSDETDVSLTKMSHGHAVYGVEQII